MSDSNSDDFIQYECHDRIATIAFNRPEKLNAFNDAMVMRLASVLHQFDTDTAADVAVLHGQGRAFCSGADVHQRQLRSEEELKKHGGSQGWGANASELFTRAINWKPIIAAPHGYAVGLGLVTEVVVAEELEKRAYELAHKLAKGPTQAYGAIKNARNQGLGLDPVKGFEAQILANVELMFHKDAREGPRAFKEGREPDFTGEWIDLQYDPLRPYE